MLTWKSLSVIASVAALALAGCGGDDDAPETPITPTGGAPSSQSKEEFITQADGICAEVNAAVGTVDASATDTASALTQKADLYQGMIERIQGLPQPDDDGGLSDFYSAGNDLVQAEQDAQLAAERGDDSGLAAAESEADTALSAFQSAAQSYGFDDCGQGPSAPATTPTTVPPGTTVPVTPSAPITTTPVTPVTPAPETPAPGAPTAPTGGAGTGGGTAGTGAGTGGSTGGSTDGGGSNTGGGGIGPG
jgi:hypothetical protein